MNLEFFAVSWADLGAAIGSKDRRLFSRILKKTEPYFEEVFSPEDFDGGPDFELGLERWVEGEVDLPHKGEPTMVENLGDALGFVALTRFYGQLVGNMNHSVSSGDMFRQEFLLGVAQQHLTIPYSLESLLSRPVLGYESDDFPFWGGLTKAELGLLSEIVGHEAPSWEPNADVDVWLSELWIGLRGSLDAGADLITLYA